MDDINWRSIQLVIIQAVYKQPLPRCHHFKDSIIQKGADLTDFNQNYVGTKTFKLRIARSTIKYETF